jgi:polyhydroxyalkanoate synthesis regulator phasin
MNLFEITNSGEPWAAERARYALQIHEAVSSGQISPSEAKELLADLIATDKLDSEATSQQMRAALVFGVTQLISMY